MQEQKPRGKKAKVAVRPVKYRFIKNASLLYHNLNSVQSSKTAEKKGTKTRLKTSPDTCWHHFTPSSETH